MTRAVPVALSISLLLSLCACAPKPSVDPAEAVSRFQQQNSVSCTIESELALNRSDTDDTENTFTEALDAEGAVNMETRDCHPQLRLRRMRFERCGVLWRRIRRLLPTG